MKIASINNYSINTYQTNKQQNKQLVNDKVTSNIRRQSFGFRKLFAGGTSTSKFVEFVQKARSELWESWYSQTTSVKMAGHDFDKAGSKERLMAKISTPGGLEAFIQAYKSAKHKLNYDDIENVPKGVRSGETYDAHVQSVRKAIMRAIGHAQIPVISEEYVSHTLLTDPECYANLKSKEEFRKLYPYIKDLVSKNITIHNYGVLQSPQTDFYSTNSGTTVSEACKCIDDALQKLKNVPEDRLKRIQVLQLLDPYGGYKAPHQGYDIGQIAEFLTQLSDEELDRLPAIASISKCIRGKDERCLESFEIPKQFRAGTGERGLNTEETIKFAKLPWEEYYPPCYNFDIGEEGAEYGFQEILGSFVSGSNGSGYFDPHHSANKLSIEKIAKLKAFKKADIERNWFYHINDGGSFDKFPDAENLFGWLEVWYRQNLDFVKSHKEKTMHYPPIDKEFRMLDEEATKLLLDSEPGMSEWFAGKDSKTQRFIRMCLDNYTRKMQEHHYVTFDNLGEIRELVEKIPPKDRNLILSCFYSMGSNSRYGVSDAIKLYDSFSSEPSKRVFLSHIVDDFLPGNYICNNR